MVIALKPSIQDYRKMLRGKVCRWCNTPLDNVPIQSYPHGDGWEVKEYPYKMWLYVECPKCKYQWALWKLGIPRPRGVENVA